MAFEADEYIFQQYVAVGKWVCQSIHVVDEFKDQNPLFQSAL